MRPQARWNQAAGRATSAAATASAASAALQPGSFAAGSSLLLRREAQQRRSGRQLTLGTEARDGKKRRKPQQAGSRDGGSSDEELLGPARPPPRVDPTNGISPKHQIRWAKMYQDVKRQASQGFRQRAAARGFRQESLDPEEHRRQREEAERIADEARKRQSDMISLQTMFHTNVSSPGEQPLGVTLIDGYNLLYRWAARQSGVAEWLELARVDTPGMLSEAREWLLTQLDLYSHLRGMYIHVVYDAMNVGYSSQYNTNGMIVSFRGKETADSYILRQARIYSEQGIQKVCIVSDDLEVALLGPAVAPRFPGQAVFSTSCGALIQLVEEGQSEALSEAERLEPVRTAHLHFSPFTRITTARSQAHTSVAKLQGSGTGGSRSSRPSSSSSSAPPGRGIGNLASLRQQLAEKEREAARAAEAERRDRLRQQRLQQQQAQQAQQRQQPEG